MQFDNYTLILLPNILMKKIVLLIFILISCYRNSYTQINQKGTSTMQIGYGFPSAMQFMGSVFNFSYKDEESEATADFKYRGLGPFHFRYEKMLGGRVGLGISANAEFGKFKFTANYNDIDDNNVTSVTTFDYSSINALLRTNIHFIKEPKAVDIYYGLGVGYSYTRVKLGLELSGTVIDPEEKQYIDEFNTYMNNIFKMLPVAVESVFGLKAAFSDNVGMYFEVGYAKAVCQLGLYLKLGEAKGYSRSKWKWY